MPDDPFHAAWAEQKRQNPGRTNTGGARALATQALSRMPQEGTLSKTADWLDDPKGGLLPLIGSTMALGARGMSTPASMAAKGAQGKPLGFWGAPGGMMRTLAAGAGKGAIRGPLFRALMAIPHPVAKIGAIALGLAPLAASLVAGRTTPNPLEAQKRGFIDPGAPFGLGQSAVNLLGGAGDAVAFGRGLFSMGRGTKGVGAAGETRSGRRIITEEPEMRGTADVPPPTPDRPIGQYEGFEPDVRRPVGVPEGMEDFRVNTRVRPKEPSTVFRPGHPEHGRPVPEKGPGISEDQWAKQFPKTASEAGRPTTEGTARRSMARQATRRRPQWERFLNPKDIEGEPRLVTKQTEDFWDQQLGKTERSSDVTRPPSAAADAPPNPRRQARQARTAERKAAQVDAAKARVGTDYKPKSKKVTLEMADGKTKTLTVLGNKGRLAEFTPDFNELYKANKSIINKAVGAANKTGWDTLAKQLNYMSHNDYSPQDIAQQLSQLWKIEGGPSMAREILKLAPESWLTQKSKAAIRSALKTLIKDL